MRHYYTYILVPDTWDNVTHTSLTTETICFKRECHVSLSNCWLSNGRENWTQNYVCYINDILQLALILIKMALLAARLRIVVQFCL